MFLSRAAIFGLMCLALACAPKTSSSADKAAGCKNNDPAAAAICTDPALQKLEGEINAALNAAHALYPNDPLAARALDDAHAGALAMRQYADGEFGISLVDAMRSERDFLLSLAPPRDGFEGRWANLQGDVLIAKEPDGFGVHAVAAEPTRGAWVCEMQAPAAQVKDMLVASGGARGAGDPPLDGWIIEAERQGATLVVKEIAPRAETGADIPLRPYCGMNGGLDGSYFPAKAK